MHTGLGVFFAIAIAGPALAQAPAAVRPVSFAKIVAQVPEGTIWAHLQERVWGCRDIQVLSWDSNSKLLQNPEFERVFRERLSAAGLKVSGDPSNLFEDDHKVSDLQVGALLTGIAARFCASQRWQDGYDSDRYQIEGDASMQIEWQVYSTTQARVVARIPTNASYALKKATDAGSVLILQQTFAANVERLAASDAFRSAVTASAAGVGAAQMGPLRVAMPAPSQAVSFNQAAKGVVSIFAGGSMGSGVLISQDGYILTNHHVAGSFGQVRVHWPDGSDSVGEVVRADRRRDVALIKTVAKAQPLPIRHAPVSLGETVFAIGTPLDKQLEGTLTRGVVSAAARMYEGQAFIQSDVGVTHGNSGGPLLDERGAVIGLTELGLFPDESKSLNLFIPIDDALRALGVTPAS